MTVLRKSGMIRYAAIKTEPTEPAIRQVQMDLAAQSAFRTDAKAIADKQHADHQFRINRWPARVTVKTGQLSSNCRQIDKAVDRAKHVISGDVAFD